MKKKKESISVHRIYRMGDYAVLKKGREISRFFFKDLKTFHAFKPGFNEAYHMQLRTWLDEATVVQNPAALREVRKILNRQILNQLSLADDRLKPLFRIIKKLSSNEPIFYSRFRCKDLPIARANAAFMLHLIENAFSLCLKKEDVLEESGFTKERISELQEISSSLKILLAEKEHIKKTHSLSSKDYIKLMNEIWQRLSEISRAAKFIYKTKKEMARHYELYLQEEKVKTLF